MSSLLSRSNARGAGIPPAATARRNTHRPLSSPARRPPLGRAIPAPLALVGGSEALGGSRANAPLAPRLNNASERSGSDSRGASGGSGGCAASTPQLNERRKRRL